MYGMAAPYRNESLCGLLVECFSVEGSLPLLAEELLSRVVAS